MTKLTELAIEDLATKLFECLGYSYVCAPDIAFDKENGEAREDVLGHDENPVLKLMSCEVRVAV